MAIQGRNVLPGNIEPIGIVPVCFSTCASCKTGEPTHPAQGYGLPFDAAQTRTATAHCSATGPTSGNRSRKIKTIIHVTEPVQAPLRQRRPVEIPMIK